MGGPSHDALHGDIGADRILGGTGNDMAYGFDDNDFMAGEKGRDLIWGGFEDDVVVGGAGDDVLGGNTGVDRFWGGGDSDVCLRASPDEPTVGCESVPGPPPGSMATTPPSEMTGLSESGPRARPG
jgi:hypothetical protein